MNDDHPLIKISDLTLTSVDSNSPVPLYYQIEQDLRRLIHSGQIPPRAILPPELELGEAYGVGRHTMRMALSRLVADNLIVRQAGRGTIVKAQTDRLAFYLDRSFTQQMAELGRTARSKVLAIRQGVIDALSPAIFQQKAGAACLYLTRLRLGDDEPIGIQATTILTQLCPDLEKFDFNQHGLYDILAREYKLIIVQIHHTISATTAGAEQATLLQIKPGDPLLVVNTTAFLGDRQPVEHTASHYRADQYEYSITHTYSPQTD